MAIALDIIKKKSGLDDTLAQQALDIKNSQGNDAFKAFVTKNKPVQIVNAPVDKTTGLSTPLAPAVQPTTSVTPTAPKVDATPGITQDSFNQAKAESEKIKAQNEAQNVSQTVNDLGGDAQNRANTRNVLTGKGGTVTPSGAILNADGTITQPGATHTTTPTTVAPTTPTPADNITKTDFQTAQAESERIKAQNEAQMALNKQQSELRQTETAKANELKTAEAKQAQDQANAQLANNEGAILNTLKVGGIIPEEVKSSPYYKTALATYNKMQQYSTYSIGQLTTALNQGNILPGTSLYNEMMKDPALKTKLTEAQIYTSSKPTDKTAMYENASTDILSSNPKTANILADGVITVEEYNQATNNDAIMAKAKEVEEKTNKYNALYAEYEAIPEKIRADFPGSPFTDAMIADAQNAKYKAVILARGEMNSADGTLTELKAQASSLFETNLKLYQDQQIEANKIKAEQRAYQQALALSQAQFDQKLAQQAQLMDDPKTQIQSTIDEFAKLGITAQGSLASKLAEFKASGKTLPDYINGLRQQFINKPEYQKIKELQMGQLSDAQKMTLGYQQDINKMAISNQYDIKRMGLEQDFQMAMAQATNVTSNKWTKLDDGMYTNEAGEIITADELKSAKLLGNSYITKQVGEEGGECGFYASRGVGMSSTPGGNSKEARTQAFSDKTPQVGGMAFFGGAGYDPTYGHIAIVTGVNQDGTINVKESNYSGTGKVTERTVPASQVTGYYNNTPLAKGVSQPTGTQGEYTDQNINDLAYLDELQTKNPTQAAKDMKELGYSARDLANYKAGNLPLTEKQKNTSTEVMNAIKDLTDSSKYEWNDAVGKFDPKRLIGTQDAEDATIAINNLVAKMTLPNLGVLKGPMSDKDMQFIKEASTKLDTRQSNASFERNLIDAYNLSARRAGMPEIKKLSDLKSGTESTVGGELDYSKYE